MVNRKFAPLLAAIAGLIASPLHAAPDETPAACPPYEMAGEGPDLLLIPGLGSSPAVWDGLKDSLSTDYRVHFAHVAGFAGREPTGEPETIVERSVAEIISYLDCTGIEDIAVAGHSMGGFLGLKLASQHPDRIDQVVVVDALPFYPLIFNPAATAGQTLPHAEQFRAGILAQSDADFEAAQRMGVRSLVKTAEKHDTVVGWSLASDRASFAGAIYALMTQDARADLPSITAPVTVIAASNAFAPKSRVEPLYSAAYQGLEGVDLRIVEDSYHFIMFDQPEQFETVLRQALSKGTAP